MVLRQPMTADKMRDKRDKFGLAPMEPICYLPISKIFANMMFASA